MFGFQNCGGGGAVSQFKLQYLQGAGDRYRMRDNSANGSRQTACVAKIATSFACEYETISGLYAVMFGD